MAIVGVVLLAGCPPNGPKPDAGECQEPSQSDRPGVESFFDPLCTPWGCGTNSATVGDGVVFDELDGSGTTDIRGVKIVSATLGDRPVQLQVERDVLSAVDASGAVYSGLALVGITIKLSAPVEGKNREYELTIEDVSPNQKNRPLVTYWAGDPDVVPSYLIKARPVGASCAPTPICKIHPPGGLPIPAGLEHDAIVFAGDKYDPAEKTVVDVPDKSSIFNLACEGAAPAKMHLMRHTIAGGWTADGRLGSDGKPPYYTSPEQRQAMLKMFTADYCGTGHSFTVDGQDLDYGDASHWYPRTPALRHDGTVSPSEGAVEAVWDDHGAVCLDGPRPALVPPDARTPPTRPVNRSDVETVCVGDSTHPPHDLKPCTGPGGMLTMEPPPLWHAISVVPVVR